MPTRRKKKLGEILILEGLITQEQFDDCLADQKVRKKKLGQLLVEKGVCRERDIATALATQLGIPLVDLKVTPVEPAAVDIIPERWARKHEMVPVSIQGSELAVAMVDPFNAEALEDAQFASGFRIAPLVATKSDIQWAIRQHYNLETSIGTIINDIVPKSSVEVLSDTSPEEQADIASVKKQSEAAPIVRIVNHVISQAVDQKASDIHIEPARDKLAVRIRVDGLLRHLAELPRWAQGAVISRIKIMSKLDIAEKRMPQDGRIGVGIRGRKLDLRVSSLPTSYGEKLVIRILDPRSSILTVRELGMEGENVKRFLSLIERPQGIVLASGPTWSGKSTTLYAALNHIRGADRNMTTIEDPIEFDLDGVNQVSVDEKAGRTFAGFLRSVLRQDPDVIMVGEMRDAETATIAMQASLTGHLVLSSIHTNNTVATITRLRNLGIPSYLIASTISGIIAQRLVRVICPSCKADDDPTPESLRMIGLTPQEASKALFFRGQGCSECGGTGFRGRVGIYEVLVLSKRIKEYIANEAAESTIRQLAVAEGMTTLTYAGMEKVLAGTTSVSGVLQIHGAEDETASLCPDCETALGSDFVACPSCGRRLIQTCPVCSKIVDPGWRFCPYCTENIQNAGPVEIRRAQGAPPA